MDAQELRNLQEAYMDVYAPQELDEGYMPPTQKRADKMMKQVSKLRRTASEKGDFGHPEFEKKFKQSNKVYNFSKLTSDLAKKRDKDAKKSEFNEDIYDIILSHLLDEGYADTQEAAEAIMVNMSEEWRESIMISEGMTMKDFKANRQKNKRRSASADAEKRGHVGKEWYNSGRKYSPDEAKRSRAKMDDEERRTRHRSAVDPDSENDDLYSADKTKNPKKLRKQKAMGELG